MSARARSGLPVALTVAGSDCSSGAGLQADLKAFSAGGVYGLTVVTCVVSEIPGRVNAIQPVGTSLVGDQLRLLLDSFPVRAVKTGMLYSREIIRRVAAVLEEVPADRRPALVVDPVMIATSGDALLKPGAVRAMTDLLFPLASLITPNLDEAGALLGKPLQRAPDLTAAAEVLRSRYGCPVLVKGGHLQGRTALDVLRDADGFVELSGRFVKGVSTHGTGCTFSAAITAGLARGEDLRTAIHSAKEYVTRVIAASHQWKSGRGKIEALNHFPA